MTAELQNSIKVIPIDLMPSTVEFHLISEAPICGTLIRMTDRTTYVFGLCDYVKSCGFFGLSQCDWSQAWFHKRSYTVTIGASSAGAIACGHLDFPTFQRTRVSPQAEKKMKKVSLCWQTSLSLILDTTICWQFQPIPLPKPFHNSPKPLSAQNAIRFWLQS